MFTFDTIFLCHYGTQYAEGEIGILFFSFEFEKTFISPHSVYIIYSYRQLSKNNGGSNILDGYVNKSDRMCTDLRAYGDRFKSSGRLSMPYVP